MDPREERGLVNGLIFAGVGAGSGLTPPLLTWLIVAGSIWWLVSRDIPEEHPCVTPGELMLIRSGIAETSNAGAVLEVPEIRQAPKRIPSGAIRAGFILSAGAGTPIFLRAPIGPSLTISPEIVLPSFRAWSMGGQIGSAITASLTPWIAQRFGWTSSFGSAAALALVAAVCWATVHPEHSIESLIVRESSMAIAD